MQRLRTYLRFLCATLLLLGASACNPEFGPSPKQKGTLSLWPQLFEGLQMSGSNTRALVPDTADPVNAGDSVEARDELRENYLRSLDVFVKRSDAAENADWFKVYHLYNVEGIEQVKHQLAANWNEEGYLPNVNYDIYATANNNHTREGAPTLPASLTELKALTTTTNSVFRYHSETDVAGSNYMRSDDENDGRKKEFLMDGKIEGWQIDPNRAEQVFDMDLNRAAVKIIVNFKYSDLKTMVLVSDDKVDPMPKILNPETGQDSLGTLKVYLENVGRTPGLPRWKYVNFVMESSDITGGALDGPTPANKYRTYGSNFIATKLHGDEVPNIDDSYTLTTYTYPIDWSDNPAKAPYLLLSVFYATADNQQWRSYYRIPVCDESKTTSLKRNHIYIVNAEIASLGASNDSFEAPDEELRIEYHVIPWTETNIQQEATVIKISDTKYLTVSPTTYTLKGNERQSIDLLWYASVSPSDQRYVDIDPSSLNISFVNYLGQTIDIKGTVTKQVRNAQGDLVTATENNTDGTGDIVITATAPTGTGTANGEKVIITITPGGIIRVASDALDSRAIKDISFDVKLKNVNDLPAEHVTIRHFPLDNLQSITGLWSSRWDGSSGTTSETVYTYDPVAAGWSEWEGFEWEVCDESTYNSLEDSERKTDILHHTDELSTPAGATNISSHPGGVPISQSEWAAGIGNNNTDRQNANSEGNAVNGYYATGGSATEETNGDYRFNNGATPTYTWNGNAVTLSCVDYNSRNRSWTYNGYDYVVGTSLYQYQNNRYRIRTNLWKYANYYHIETLYDYDLTHYFRKKYYRTEEVVAPPSTGQWVDWDRDNGQTYNEANAKYTTGLNFTAKIFNTSDSKIYAIGVTNNDNNYTYNRATSQTSYGTYSTSGTFANTTSSFANLTNNQMYVVQVTASSTQFVLGKPVLDANYQSQDHVASPAFMIASQLGATMTFNNGADAATHCGTYMEVGMDGTRYVNWRLPTAEEIGVIIQYQDNNKVQGTTMVKVLGGAWYWTLNGSSANVPSGSGGSQNGAYTRCIRDMSLEEINALNNR